MNKIKIFYTIGLYLYEHETEQQTQQKTNIIYLIIMNRIISF